MSIINPKDSKMANYRIRTGVGGSGPAQSLRPSVNARLVPGIAPNITYFEIAREGTRSPESCFYNFGGVDIGISIGLNFGSTSSWSSFASDVRLDEFGGIVHFPTVGAAVVGGYNVVSELRFATGNASGLVINTVGWTLGVQASFAVTVSAGVLFLDASDSSMHYFFFAEGYIQRIFSDVTIPIPERLGNGMSRTLYERGRAIAETDRTQYNIQWLRRHIIRNYYQEANYDESSTDPASPINEMVRRTMVNGDYRGPLQNRIRDYIKYHPTRMNDVKDGWYRFRI